MKIRYVTLLAALGVLMAAPAYADPISGLVHADGTVEVASSLYTVTQIREGRYLITFTNPMTPQANCIVTPLSHRNPNIYVSNIRETATSCDILTGDNGRRANTDFTFIATPMSN